MKLLQEAATDRLVAAVEGRRAARPRRARWRSASAPTSRARAATRSPRPSARSRTSPPSTASTARSRSTRAASARSPATSSRRPPTARGRWSPSACCTATATSASASTPAAGSTSTGSTPTRTACPPRSSRATTAQPITITVPIGDYEVTAQIWRVDIGGIPLYLLDAERPENSQTAKWITSPPVHRRRGHAPGAVHAARHRRRPRAGGDGDRARPRAPQRGPRRVRVARARAPQVQRQRLAARRAGDRPHSARSSPPTRRSRPATTPTRRSRSRTTLAQIAGTLGVDAEEIITPRPHEPGGGGRAVRRHAVRAAHQPRRQRRRRAATARSRARCGTRCGPSKRRRRRPDHLRHQRRAHPDLARPADVGAAEPAPRRGLAGPRDRPRDVGAGRRHPGQGAVGRPHARSAAS